MPCKQKLCDFCPALRICASPCLLANARLALIAKHRHCIGKPEFSILQDAWALAHRASFPELYPQSDMAVDILYATSEEEEEAEA